MRRAQRRRLQRSRAARVDPAKRLQPRGIIGSPEVWPQVLRFLAKTGLALSVMVTQSFPLHRVPEANAAFRRTDEGVKVHVQHGGAR